MRFEPQVLSKNARDAPGVCSEQLPTSAPHDGQHLAQQSQASAADEPAKKKVSCGKKKISRMRRISRDGGCSTGAQNEEAPEQRSVKDWLGHESMMEDIAASGSADAIKVPFLTPEQPDHYVSFTKEESLPAQ